MKHTSEDALPAQAILAQLIIHPEKLIYKVSENCCRCAFDCHVKNQNDPPLLVWLQLLAVVCMIIGVALTLKG